MTNEQLFTYLFIVVMTAANAAADGIMIRWILRDTILIHNSTFLVKWGIKNCSNWTRAQWFWHGFKWVFFFAPIIKMLYDVQAPILHLIPLTVVCYFLWEFVYKYEKIYEWTFKEN